MKGLIGVVRIDDRGNEKLLWERGESIAARYPVLPDTPQLFTAKTKVKNPGFIYLFHGCSTEWYKIGITKTPLRRNKQIGSKLPFPCDLLAYYEVLDMNSAESFWHNRFSDKRVNGEWFTLSPDDVDLFVNQFSEVYSEV